jgi:hypothetical protein
MKKDTRRLALGLALGLVPLLLTGMLVLSRAAAEGNAEQASPDGSRQELRQLIQARHDAALRLLDAEEKKLREGRATLENVCEASRRVRDSALELEPGAEGRLAALTNYLAATRRLEESINRVVAKGHAPVFQKDLARYLRLDAEIAVRRATQPGTKTP